MPVRVDVPALVGAPVGRREGHHLAAISVGVQLACETDWRSDTLEPFCAVGWAAQHGLAWRRLRRALDQLSAANIAAVELHPFQPGKARITDREQPTSALHDRSRADERFVALGREALAAIAAEHDLSWVAVALLVALLLVCDYRSGELSEGCWTKTALCETYGIGWRRLTHGLRELAAAGLITYCVRRGGAMSLALVARAALVVPTGPPKAPLRRERRAIQRDAANGAGPGGQLASRLMAHYGLPGCASHALIAALGDALAAGLASEDLLGRLVARGNLAGAHDAMAVLVARARQVCAQLSAAREEQERRRKAQMDQMARQADVRADEEARRSTAQGEDRWLAQVLQRLPMGGDLGLPGGLVRPTMLAAQIHVSCAEVVARWPELDPAGLVSRWAARPCDSEALDVSGLATRSGVECGTSGRLPQARDGPSLAERLRNQLA